MDMETAKQHHLTRVNVKPQLSAGGALAVAAYNTFENVCMVMDIQADAGVDIGDTIIGMHLKPVVVPVRPRIENRKIGEANSRCRQFPMRYLSDFGSSQLSCY